MLRIAACRIAMRHSGAGASIPTHYTTAVASKLAHARAFSSGITSEGRRRQYEDNDQYPRPRSTRPDRPEQIATEELMNRLDSNAGDKAELLEKIKVTDDEVNRIYDSIMGVDHRKERDEQSLRHKSRAQHLEIRRQSREWMRGGVPDKHNTQNNAEGEDGATDNHRDGRLADAINIRPISEKTMEEMIYVDTRAIRDMEEARRAVIASTDSNQIQKLEEKIREIASASASAAPTKAADTLSETDAAEEKKGLDLDTVDAEADELFSDFAPELSVSEFNHVIFANMLAGRADEAVRAYELLLDSGLQPDQTTFANLTVAHAKAGDLDTAVSMFKKLEDRGLEPTIYSYGTLIKAYMEFDRIDDAFGVYETMKTREMWPNLPVYNSLIVACLKVGDYKRAWGVFEHLRYTIAKPDEISFSIMIHACAKNGEVEKAMNLFEEMISNKLALSDVTFNSLIHACALRPDYFDEGFRLLQLMEANGFQPDFYTYNTLIYACARKKNLGLARDLFRDMLEKSMDPRKQGLLKIDPVTISNMMWAYAGYLYTVKTCSWKMARKYETLAMDVLQEIKAESDSSEADGHIGQALTKADKRFGANTAFLRLVDAQERAAQATRDIQDTVDKDIPKEARDQQRMSLINTLMPEDVPSAHNSVGSEAARLMRFYVDVLKGSVNAQLLNAYMSAMICNGRFRDAWKIFLHDFDKYNVSKDGWTFQRMIRLCARTRDVPSGWRVWDEFKAWRADVEKALKTPGHEQLKRSQTMVYRSATDGDAVDKDAAPGAEGDAAALNRASQDMLALAEGLVFPGENVIPQVVAGGAMAVLPSDRETARKQIGCGMKAEHATYIEMITLLGSCGDFRAAIKLIREEKNDILEHKHNPTMEDVSSLYQNALVAGDKHSTLDIRGLCMQKPAHSARRALHRKWGTSFSWDLTDPQQKSLSRRFPEEFRRHKAPFKDGEQVLVSNRR
ncbi:hypothetical protein LPJ66_008086 [Kickxella alabastrina]|uniref:Uncharacterized protein n=1 Tax=Kickxella alabastrina TaxID=61397 RepID=A0ACC1I7P6_9FUNG|nr:hypothetical protein LPJ66_008086 [Kickxella alabastrina]